MNYVGLITVRTSSSRLKNKCLLNIGKFTKVIEHVILRCLSSSIKPILCTTENKSDDILVEISQKFGINFFRGSEKNKIYRWYKCVKQYDLKYFHTVDADDLYFDPEAIKKSLDFVMSNDIDIVHPSKISRYGGASEGYSFSKKGINKLCKSLGKYYFENINSFDTEMIDTFVKNAKLKEHIFKGQSYEYKGQIRFTLDYKEDFKMFQILFDKFGIYEKRSVINDFLHKNKKILDTNFFRNKQWDEKQKSFEIALKKLR